MAEARYRALVEQIPAIVYTADFGADGAWSYVSPQIEEILGYTPAEWMADPELWYQHLYPDDREIAMDQEARAAETGERLASEYRMVTRSGDVVWFRDDAVVVSDAAGRPITMQGVMYDISDRKRAEQELAFLAYHDKLTGLPNRQMFEELLSLAIARAKRNDLAVAVLFVDLDDFKLVNDNLGHAAGDQLLQQVAERLRAAVRETDIVARQGGDEFLILLSDMERVRESPLHSERENPQLVAEAAAGRICDSLAAPMSVAGAETYVSGSIGISLYPTVASDVHTLLKHADAAMYQSKRALPGGFMVFSPTAHASQDRFALATGLRRAVELRQWELHYQPLMDLRDARMMGVEALVRWRDPQGGLVPPGDFIPLAEEMGLIAAIGDWVLESLCAQGRSWRDAGLRLELNFNLSPRQLWQSDLVKRIMEHLHEAGVDPGDVVIEVTESAAMTDPERTQRILTDLHDRGLRLAIDDFGTGHSSLARLKHLPIETLKIDRSFVRDLPDDRDAAAMVRAMIQLADGLGIRALGEGIETEDQWRFLQDAGCTLGQGFLFSRPVPAEEIPGLIRRFDDDADENRSGS
ncbi:MAG TPA: EAL domain-containing protein [Actinomycetota bacterium]|nr:EAL domain-containing protein [Actinomycetota bacterium]